MSNPETPNLTVVVEDAPKSNILVRGARRVKSSIESHPKISLAVGVAGGFLAGSVFNVFGPDASDDEDETTEVEETDADVA